MIEINNLSKKNLETGFLKIIGQNILKEERKSGLEISVVLIGQSEIKDINRKYRNKNKPTDVLSFLYGEIGEIAICLNMVKGGKEGLSRVFIHGLLHLLGYNHEKTQKEAKIMKQKENYYLTQKYGKK